MMLNILKIPLKKKKTFFCFLPLSFLIDKETSCYFKLYIYIYNELIGKIISKITYS